MTATRIPSALTWLLQKRARLLGCIQRHERAVLTSEDRLKVIVAGAEDQIGRFAAAVCHEQLQLERLRTDIESVDHVIRQYSDNSIDPEQIGAIQPVAPRLAKHGSYTKQIRRILAGAPSPMTTTQIATLVAELVGRPEDDGLSQQFREKIRFRLKAMAARSQVKRHHISDASEKNGREGCWSSATSDDDSKALMQTLLDSLPGAANRTR